MLRQLMIALRLGAATLVLTGVVYPLLMTALAQLLFPHAANGSLTRDARGEVVGSAIVGQSATSPSYFQPRPSAAGAGYDASASSGSNLGPTSARLRDRMRADVGRLLHENPGAPGPVPADLVTASASGLDPHLSPVAARWQAPRVARARGIALDGVEELILARIEPRTFGVLGEPRVNVLLLNLDLDRRFGRPAAPPGSSGSDP